MKPLKRAWTVVGEFRRTYLAINVAYYGLIFCAMIYVAFNPALQQSLVKMIRSGFSKGPLAVVTAAYREGRVFSAIVLTFVVNLIGGAFLAITLPSLVIPFSGLLVGAWRAVLWGLALSPITPVRRTMLIPHSLTLILEGQAYVVAMLAAAIQGSAFLWPRIVGARTHLQGYAAGLKRTARLYLLVMLILAIAAIYEAVEVIYIVPLLPVAP